MLPFKFYLGVDYSGAKTPASRLTGIRVYETGPDREPTAFRPADPAGKWSRKSLASALRDLATVGRDGESRTPFIVGIDHGFSFPDDYFGRYLLSDWDEFLDDFCKHWPTDREGSTVNSLRKDNPRTGEPDEFRLTEKWTSSAKSVFQFDVPGQVAPSTHAGIPWLAWLRRERRDQLHFWPFDGWDIPSGKSVIAEVYPSIFRNRYPRAGRGTDEHDAYAIARWLQEADGRGILDRYFQPPLVEDERCTAQREGWILGIV